VKEKEKELIGEKTQTQNAYNSEARECLEERSIVLKGMATRLRPAPFISWPRFLLHMVKGMSRDKR
jgi:hypothetical protein